MFCKSLSLFQRVEENYIKKQTDSHALLSRPSSLALFPPLYSRYKSWNRFAGKIVKQMTRQPGDSIRPTLFSSGPVWLWVGHVSVFPWFVWGGPCVYFSLEIRLSNHKVSSLHEPSAVSPISVYPLLPGIYLYGNRSTLRITPICSLLQR